MRRLGMFTTLCLGLAAPAANADRQDGEFVYIGTHGGDRENTQGIYAARLDTRTGHLSPLGLQAELERATWLVTHPRRAVIYSVADSGSGPAADSGVVSFAIDRSSGRLSRINQADAGGVDATHLAIDGASKTLFAASYGSGTLSALPLQPDGSLGSVASSQKDYGTGPHPRQKMPIAHGVAIDPTHRYVLVADFGADRLFVHHFDSATRTLTPAAPPFEAIPPGSGPRHLAFSADGHFLYLVTELTAEVRTYHWDAAHGQLQLVQALATYPADYAGKARSAAEIAVSADGRHVYLSLRGDQDSLVNYAVDRKSGALQEIQRLPSGGKSPWSFGIDRTNRWMLVTNEASNTVNVFSIDPATGILSATTESIAVSRPVTVTFYAK